MPDLGPPPHVETVVVTATRTARDAFDVPASVDRIGGERIRESQLQVNLSETLPALAGVVANNRQNYAQDLQVSIRGFGARSTFGVRGLRILVDGIPATLPDGQSQVSHVDLASAERIEVLRGPFSVLYGNSSGGVIDIATRAPAQRPERSADVAFGAEDTRRFAALASDTAGSLGYLVSANRFETDGYRDHSHSVRKLANAKARWQAGAATTATFVASFLDMPGTQDPLGLTREQFEADPRSVAAPALLFDTRKSVDQAQAGVVVDHAVGSAGALRIGVHGGSRGTQQFQSIPVAPQLGPLHPGGVIDLQRGYAGVDARWSWTGEVARSPFTLVAGASADRLEEDRRGYRNFVGSELGVLGELRRDETNRVVESGVFAQAEWEPVAPLRLLAGVRASRVTFRSADHFVTGVNPDDSGATAYSATTPVAGLVWRVAPTLNGYVSAGRGFETPTTNELAYRSDGASGLNLSLRPARSDHLEAGFKWREDSGWRASAALFRVDTEDEIVVDTNVGGRSTFRNAGGTRREGAEVQAERQWGPLGVALSASTLRAVYQGAFSGNRIPGVPERTAYVDLRWSPTAALVVGLEARHSAKLFVNDANSDAAPAYTVAGARVACEHRLGGATVRAFLRVDNLFDRRYAGSVIVNEGNSRFFEPAPQRTWVAGVSIAWRH